MTKTQSVTFTAIVLLAASLPIPVSAQTVYVSDMLRVGVRAEPSSSLSPIAIVTTGDALEVLDRRNGYLQVRTSQGVEGWINDAYATEEMPARRLIEMVREERDRLSGELEALRSQSAASTRENERMSAEMEELLEENSALHARLSKQYSSGTKKDRYVWMIVAGSMLGLLLGGFFLGVRWYRQRVAALHGGLTI